MTNSKHEIWMRRKTDRDDPVYSPYTISKEVYDQINELILNPETGRQGTNTAREIRKREETIKALRKQVESLSQQVEMEDKVKSILDDMEAITKGHLRDIKAVREDGGLK